MSKRQIDEMVGVTVNRVTTNKIKNTMTFETDNGIFKFCAYGGCCSFSWFSKLQGLEKLIGEKITELDILPFGKTNWHLENEDGHDCLMTYQTIFKTAKGTTNLYLTNDSNGYYDGWYEIADKNSIPEGEQVLVEGDFIYNGLENSNPY